MAETEAHHESHAHHDHESHEKSSSGKPILAIAIGCFVLLAIVGFGLSYAFGWFAKQVGSGMVEKAIESQTGVKTNISDLEQGKMSFTDEKTGQSVTIGSQEMPQGFPQDMPVYPGSKVAGSVSGTGGQGNDGFLVTFTTPDAMDKVVTYYKTNLASNGWTTSATFNTEKMQTMGVKKGTMEGSISITADENQTTILITIGENE